MQPGTSLLGPPLRGPSYIVDDAYFRDADTVRRMAYWEGLGELLAANAAFMQLASGNDMTPLGGVLCRRYDYQLQPILRQLRLQQRVVTDTIEWMMEQVDEERRMANCSSRAEEEAEQQKELQSLDQGRLKCTAKEPFPQLQPAHMTAVADFLATWVFIESRDYKICMFCNGELLGRCDACNEEKICCRVCDVHLRSTYLLPGVDAAYSFCVPCLQDREVDVDYFSTFY